LANAAEYQRERLDGQGSAIDMLKLEMGCMDCGYAENPVALDFDHVKGVKLLNIGMNRHRDINLILEEIDKCEVVCANCHRIRTANRRSGA
jgi:hypothetical protein